MPCCDLIEAACCLQVKQYDHDVETAIASARAYFDSYPRQANASQIIVLDIDETALSNRAEWLTALEGIRGGGIVLSLQVCPLQHAALPAHRLNSFRTLHISAFH